MNIPDFLQKKLAADQAVAAIVGDRIYPVRAPQGVDAPYITYQRQRVSRWRTAEGPTGDARALFQVRSWSDDYEQAVELGDAVGDALDGFQGDFEGHWVEQVKVEDERDDVVPPNPGAELPRCCTPLLVWVDYEESRPLKAL
jgi:hypothetical protein